MLENVSHLLDEWISEQNIEVEREGFLHIGRVSVKILGQMALIEAAMDLHLAATQDVDALVNAGSAVKSKLNELLEKHGKHLDVHAHEIWMPEETQYRTIFKGKNLDVSVALPEYVLLSKALKAFDKNRNLIVEYIAKGPHPTFLKLAEKYNLDLERFLS